LLQTALDLRQNNFEVYILSDGVGSQNSGEVKTALKVMAEAGACVTTSESIIFRLLGDAKHEKFKHMARLMKDFKEETKIAVEFMANL
jgi:isochorismate hydrolase